MRSVTAFHSADPSRTPWLAAGVVMLMLAGDDIDQFCRAGEMQHPLHVVTIPVSIRTDFGYQGDGSTGVSIGGSLLLGTRHQRDILAVGTELPVAHVQVRAHTIGR